MRTGASAAAQRCTPCVNRSQPHPQHIRLIQVGIPCGCWFGQAELLSLVMGVLKHDWVLRRNRGKKKPKASSFVSLTTPIWYPYQMKTAQATGISHFTVQLEFSKTLNVNGLKDFKAKREQQEHSGWHRKSKHKSRFAMLWRAGKATSRNTGAEWDTQQLRPLAALRAKLANRSSCCCHSMGTAIRQRDPWHFLSEAQSHLRRPDQGRCLTLQGHYSIQQTPLSGPLASPPLLLPQTHHFSELGVRAVRASTGKIKRACSHPKKSQHQYPWPQSCPLLPSRARGTAYTSPAPGEPTLPCCFAVEAIECDPVFSRENQYFQSQNERYEAAVRKAVHLQKKMHEMGWTEDGPEFKYIYRWFFFFNVQLIFC